MIARRAAHFRNAPTSADAALPMAREIRDHEI
jgi:hypothetical protein